MQESFSNLPRPLVVDGIKIWPASFHGDDKWFIAYQGTAYYFRHRGSAIKWIKANTTNQDTP